MRERALPIGWVQGAVLSVLIALAGMAGLLPAGCAVSGGTWGLWIEMSPEKEGPRVLEVKGLEDSMLVALGNLPEAGRQAVLKVWVASAPAGSPALLGEVKRHEEMLVFEPRYAFQPGLAYRVRFDAAAAGLGAGGGKMMNMETVVMVPPPPPGPRVKVAEIYPSGDVLPENLLRFYIHFTGPMSRGEAYKHIHLFDESGKQVPWPFLELAEELWNPEMTRFTLFFDPGRIKQGLVPRQEMGPAMVAGKMYTLVVDADWQDDEHRPMTAGMRKVFRAGPADSAQPDVKQWKVTAPAAGTRGALVLALDKPLDHAMLQRVLTVEDAGGQEVKGTIQIGDHERRWSFVPDVPWTAGRHVVAVQTILEDEAGNSIAEAFEVDVNKGPAAAEPAWAELAFEVK